MEKLWECKKCGRFFPYNTPEELKKLIDKHESEHKLFKRKSPEYYTEKKPKYYSKRKR